MFRSDPFRKGFTACGALALALLAGCSDALPLGPAESTGVAQAKITPLVVPPPANVIVAGADAGAFSRTVIANNSGRAASEFWDNLSADNNGTNTSCNVGFFATHTLGTNCLRAAPNSNHNAGLTSGYTKYWGDGPQARDPSSFMFSGGFSYTVTLLGSYLGTQSQEVGWFTKTAGVYTFHPVAGWANRTINTAITINTGGANWGFYIKNDFNPTTGGCANPTHDCSDATGGFSAIPFQQFALFLNPASNTYLVGVEDNKLETIALPAEFDSDYNDFILLVEPTSTATLQGRMTGGGGKLVAVGGGAVTYGFTLHCDILKSNNLEINWPGNKWHLAKPITLADCQDDPTIAPKPPAAPFDTFNGEGLGKLNGVPGSKVVFTFIDDGEGAKSGDKARLTIYAPDGVTVVLNVPLQSAAKGNIQAHYDQPHGQKP